VEVEEREEEGVKFYMIPLSLLLSQSWNRLRDQI
jgi:hypothetical protein